MPNANVGFLLATTPSDWATYLAAFRSKLRQLNPSARLKVHPSGGAGGDPNDVLTAARDLASDTNIQVIVTAGTQGALACKTATTTKPFVFASVGDATISGLAGPANRNYTGGSNGQVTYVPQRVAHMLANTIFVNKFAVVGNHNNQPTAKAMDDAHAELTRLGKQVLPLNQTSLAPGDDIQDFIDGLQSKGVKSLYCCSDLWLTVQSTVLNLAAHGAGMKTMWEIEAQKQIHFADDAYGVSFKDMFDKAAEYVDQILRNTPPANLPIFEPLPQALKKKKKAKAYPAKKAAKKKQPSKAKKKKSRR
jgi:ABC-type uncharacterized transport system substrate-binding protein